MTEPPIVAVSPPFYMAGMRPEELAEQLTALLVFMAVQGVQASKRNGGKLTVAQFVNPPPHVLAKVRDEVPHSVWSAAHTIAQDYVAAAVDMKRPASALALDVLGFLDNVREIFGTASKHKLAPKKGGR